MITKEIIESVKNRISIVDIVSLYVELKKRGQSYMACCPFHNENTPSFSVSPRNNIFKCFGCGESGDAIAFVEKMENVDFIEAVKIIAKHYDIPIVEEENSLTEEQIKIREAKAIVKAAQDFFCQNLQNSKEALEYLQQRDISDEMIKKFALGYAEQLFNKWYLHAEAQKFSTQLQLQLGLLSNNEGNIYDKFHKRIIFPIHNQYGEPIGFAGRLMEKAQNQAKYVNSQDSFLYHKSSILYGLHLAKQTIREKEKCYLVEGYFDVITMHQAKICNTVSSSGTSLTDGQCQVLKKYTNVVTVLYDGDEPGIKSANKAIEKLLPYGFKINVIILPDNDDPDSFIKKHPNEDIAKILADLENDFLTFKINSLQGEDVNTKTAHLKELIQLISTSTDDVYKAMLLQKVKNFMGLQNSVVQVRGEKKKRDLPKLEPKNVDPIERCEKEIIRLLLTYFNDEDEGVHIGKYILQETSDINFKNPDYREILQVFLESQGPLTFNDVFNRVGDKLKPILIDIVSVKHEISENWGEMLAKDLYDETENLLKLVRRTILVLKQRIIHQMIKEKKQDLHTIDNPDAVDEILQQLATLKQYEVMIHQEIKK